MLTAKNYAAQAESFFLRSAKSETNTEISGFYSYIAERIRRSVHFVVPDGGQLLSAGGRSLIGQLVRLPYEFITIEYFVGGDVPKRLVWASHAMQPEVSEYFPDASESDEFMIIGAVTTREESPDHWVPDKGIAIVPCMEWEGPVIDGVVGKRALSVVSLPNCWAKQYNIQQLIEDTRLDNRSNVSSVFELIEALTCRNVSTTIHQPVSPVNNKRVAAGKLPIYETKALVVATSTSGTVGSSDGVGTHVSPRQHLRRGHIRRLPSGNIWVNSCVVGDPSKGRIDKTYIIS